MATLSPHHQQLTDGVGGPAASLVRETCPHCDKPLATDEDGEMDANDSRVTTLCWARSERGEICPARQVELDRRQRAREDDREWDDHR